MAGEAQELAAYREATRLRLAPTTVKALRDLVATYEAMGDRRERQQAIGLTVLLNMHDKLEIIRHGQ